MTKAHLISEKIRTLAILLTGVLPLSLQPAPVAAEAVAERQVDRLLDQLPVGQEDLPSDVELQCHLISLVTDAVTLRAAVDHSSGPDALPAVSSAELPTAVSSVLPGGCPGFRLPVDFESQSEEQPRGP